MSHRVRRPKDRRAKFRGVETGALSGQRDRCRIGERFLAFPQGAPELQRQSVGILALQPGRDHQAGRRGGVAGKVLGTRIDGNARTSRQRFNSIIR